MVRKLYMKMSLDNIKRNKEITLPYMIAMAVLFFMFDLVLAVAFNKGTEGMPGGDAVRTLFTVGTVVLLFIAIAFAVYLNNFVIKKRIKEYGMYNILGLEKKHVIMIMLLENTIIYVLSFVIGTVLALSLSKIIFMLFLKICHTSENSRFIFSIYPYRKSAELFIITYIVISIKNIITVIRFNSIELLKTDKKGDKTSVFEYIIALAGIVIMAISYYVANRVDNETDATVYFMFCALGVIIATYMIFPAGSHILLRRLKNNKKFYYRPTNFISTGSLMYRMRQNAIGLASICILSTMVVVTGAYSFSLFFSAEANSKILRPDDIAYTMSEGDNVMLTKDLVYDIAKKNNVTIDDYRRYNYRVYAGELNDGEFTRYSGDESAYTKVILIELADYEELTGQNIILDKNQILLFTSDEYKEDTLSINNAKYTIVNADKNNILTSHKYSKEKQRIYIVAREDDIYEIRKEYYKMCYVSYDWNSYGDNDVNSTGADNEEMSVEDELNALLEDDEAKYTKVIINCSGDDKDRYNYAKELKENYEYKAPNYSFVAYELYLEENYAIFGGTVFLGIFCIIIFLTITILIIYFKQVNEGYEDRERFVILQKVGMDKQMVVKTINRQIMIVFFAPLIVSIIHVFAALKSLRLMIMYFQTMNMSLIYGCIIGMLIIFVAVYFIVYKITSKVYYGIVKF